ncbi:MAG: hypothetical protein M0Z65_10730 [Firmicutes bacterium]|uniref:Uncharacterized protein n=1 Tax=Kroppenstedtia guangzhouensis TaxID=1274356 RepID=A0ABQ1GNC2_9BACL|nr:hypothetical protein [Kroppenstedtia guangzhouensis]EGK10202.1 hypothetical protein HMPREF9374_2552 [Desmospora sp. 8437]MDA8353632.1 hypothetical protein [Bacillota bacterium]GGA46910.1 hypothetical protein GCM10007416_20110 [Kroppenstedtia guangzhouensis]
MKQKRRYGFHQRILDLIKQGEEVHSRAMGRWGRVTGGVAGINDPNYPAVLRIKSVRGGIECVTCFEVGDRVELVYEDGKWWIVNSWEVESNGNDHTGDPAASV